MEFEQLHHDIKQLFLEECKKLKKELLCDFTGVALQKQTELDVTWPFVCGNRNTKYQYITVRFGKGIAGKVISTSSPMKIMEFPNGIIGKSTDYPIMLAEQLISAYAVPLLLKGVPRGALLIGYRQTHDFKESDLQSIKTFANQVEAILPLYFEVT
jgi:nitrogen regulatory protein A